MSVTFVAESVRENPMYTHIVLGKEDGWDERRAYFTRAGGYMNGKWAECSGHYNMSIVEATADFTERLERGY